MIKTVIDNSDIYPSAGNTSRIHWFHIQAQPVSMKVPLLAVKRISDVCDRSLLSAAVYGINRALTTGK